MGKSGYIDFKVIKKQARSFRKEMTSSEKLFWEQLRNRKLSGLKFLRQHPLVYKADFKGLNYFIADFYCNQKKTIIELDGSVHDESKEYDEFRDSELKRMGIKTLRIRNEELTDMEYVLQKIQGFLNS
jgi:very-short-patch-repair endonuclease